MLTSTSSNLCSAETPFERLDKTEVMPWQCLVLQAAMIDNWGSILYPHTSEKGLRERHTEALLISNWATIWPQHAPTPPWIEPDILWNNDRYNHKHQDYTVITGWFPGTGHLVKLKTKIGHASAEKVQYRSDREFPNRQTNSVNKQHYENQTRYKL